LECNRFAVNVISRRDVTVNPRRRWLACPAFGPPVSPDPPFLSFDWLMSPFTVMPIQMFNWTSRPEAAFHHNAAAAGLVLVVMTLSMNALAIYLRYLLRRRIRW
jgi:ABC-type phosphate transport system permease subunit